MLAGRMTKFRIDELSGVNSPAQKGARVTIMKRDDTEAPVDAFIKRAFTDKKRKALAESGAAMPGGEFPIETKGDLENAIRAFGRAKDKAATKAHIISRAKALGASNLIPDSWSAKADPSAPPPVEGSTMTPEIKKALGLPDTATDAQVAEAIAKSAAATVALTKANERLARKAKASAGDKKHIDDSKMNDDDADDFLQKSDAERASIIAKAAEGDETLTSAGVTIRKSEVGAAAFTFMKAQATALTESQAAFAKAEDERKTAIYKSRVQTEMGYLPGTVDEHVSVLKGIDLMPEAARAVQLNIIKAANATAEMAFTKYGAGAGNGGEATSANPKDAALAKLDSLASDISKTASISFAKAYDQACQSHPELYEAATARPN